MFAHAHHRESGSLARDPSAGAMVNSSPEYSMSVISPPAATSKSHAINLHTHSGRNPPRTKPGLHHLRKRDKPLRTYGRQPSAPSPQNEPPPLKKQRLSTLQRHQADEEPSSTPDSANDAPIPEPTPITSSSETTKTNDEAPNHTKLDIKRAPSSKASILSYFKPAPATPKPQDKATQPLPQEPPTQPDDDDDEPSPPPASPPTRKTSSRRRKPRLLKIKPTTHEPPYEPPQEQDPDETTTPDALAEAASSTTPRKRSSLRKPSPRHPSEPSSSSSSSSKSSSPSVQTTLNISARAAFAECKICDTVWNPLYPDDVKVHDKAHRAVLRAQKKRVMDEL